VHFSYYKRPLFILFICYSLFILIYPNFYYKKYNLDEQISVCGKVISYPEEANHFSSKNIKFEFKSSVNKLKFIVYSFDNFTTEDISLMDSVCIDGKVNKPYSSNLPGVFSWSKYLKKRDIYFEIRANKITKISPSPFIFRISNKLRKRMLNLYEVFDKNEKSVLSGIVLGIKTNIDKELKSYFQRSSTAHILVASGGNVAIMALFLNIFLSFFYIGRKARIFIVILMCGFYSLATGLDPPILRAYLMLCLYLIVFFIQRKISPFQILILTAFLILIYDPHLIFDAGFQMSFFAVYGIIIGFSCYKFEIKNKVIGFVYNLFMTSLFAQLALLPVMIFYFNSVSLIGPISNMFIVPLSSAILVSGIIIFIFSFYAPFFNLIAFAAKFMLSLLIKMVCFFGSLKYSAIEVYNLNLFSYFFLIISIFIILHYPLFKFKRKYIYLFVSLLFFFISTKIKSGEFKSNFSKSKNKSGIIYYNGKVSFINPFYLKAEEVDKILSYYGLKDIDFIFITSEIDNRNYKEIIDRYKNAKIFAPLWTDIKADNVVKVWPGDKFENFTVLWKGNRAGYSGFKKESLWYCYENKYLITQNYIKETLSCK
jgi:competence protein ComEC